MSEAHICNHPKVAHVVVYWIGKYDKSAPVTREFPDLYEAEAFAKKILRQNSEKLVMLKIFRADSEFHVCFRWDSPKKGDEENAKVTLEVDAGPMKEMMDNVALGFENHGKAIRRLRNGQVILGTVLLIDLIEHLFNFIR